jgi:hypothetical protein
MLNDNLEVKKISGRAVPSLTQNVFALQESTCSESFEAVGALRANLTAGILHL